MQNNTSKILIILLILAIGFASYQTFRLQKAAQSENNLKLQFSTLVVGHDKFDQQLQDAYAKITLLKEENAHLMLLLDEQRQLQSAEQAQVQEAQVKAQAEELKKRLEAVLGDVPLGETQK